MKIIHTNYIKQIFEKLDTINRILDSFYSTLSAFALNEHRDKMTIEEKIDRVFNINVKAPVMMLKYLLKKKKVADGGSLVWMSSYGAEKVEPGLGIYAASKSAVNGFMRAYAKELIVKKIRSNSIMPMMIKTELISTLTTISEEDWKKQEAMYPLGFGAPQDVARVAMFLFSDASRWITGTQFRMGGGSDL